MAGDQMTAALPVGEAGRGHNGWARGGGQATRRRAVDRLATVLCAVTTVLVLLILASILSTLVYNGIGGLSLHALFRTTSAPGQDGGLANAIVGSLIQTGLATLIGAPVGLMTGIYLAEFEITDAPVLRVVRFVSDMLLSAPSILIGLFVYMILVAPLGHFSGISGAVALAILVVPVVVRTTEDMLRLVPVSMREAGIALGAPRWKVVIFICLRAARAGVVTGILLALARVSGETAPLLFTSLGNMNWSVALGQPMASLPVTIYQYAGSAYDDWVQLAWTGALLITAGILFINIAVRLSMRRGND